MDTPAVRSGSSRSWCRPSGPGGCTTRPDTPLRRWSCTRGSDLHEKSEDQPTWLSTSINGRDTALELPGLKQVWPMIATTTPNPNPAPVAQHKPREQRTNASLCVIHSVSFVLCSHKSCQCHVICAHRTRHSKCRQHKPLHNWLHEHSNVHGERILHSQFTYGVHIGLVVETW